MPSLSYTPFYAGGDITLTNGSTTFSLAVGALVTNAKPGDHILVDGEAAIGVIASITGETEGELLFAWSGSTVTTGDYTIQHTGPFWHTTAEAVTRANELLKRMIAGGNLWGTDGQPTADVGYEGDYAIEVEGSAAVIYHKDVGGWDAGTILVGNSVQVGTGAPDNGSGEDGDLYIRTSNGQVYTKAAGAWGPYAVLTGAAGPAGKLAAPSWLFSTSTTDADPGNGNVRFNSVGIESVTQIYIDLITANGGTYTAGLDAWDDSGDAGNRGSLFVIERADAGKWGLFQVTGTVVAASSHRKISVTRIASSVATGALFSASAELGFAFTPRGATGETGAAGTNPGVRLAFRSATSGNPGAGGILLNHASIGSVTQVAINDLDALGVNIEAWIQALDDATNAVSRGTLTITNPATDAACRLAITGAAVDQAGYWTLTVAPLGGTIPVEATACVVSSIAAGNDGAPGINGSNGTNGGQGIPGPASTPMAIIYQMDASTADGDPGAGKVRFDNADWALATHAYLDDVSYAGVDVSAWLAAWDDRGTTEMRGTLLVIDVENPAKFLLADVSGSIVDGSGYRKATIAKVAAGATPNTYNTNGNDSFTKVLLHMDGANASTSVIDSNAGGSAHTWTANGNAQISTAQSMFGGSSGYFDGTGDSFSMPSHADLALGSGDFCIDGRFFSNVPIGTNRAIATRANGSLTAAGSAFYLRRDSSGVISFSVSNGSTFAIVNGTTQFSDTLNPGWHHYAVVRTGNVIKLLIDGNQEGGNVAFTGTVPNPAEPLIVGAFAGNALSWLGWLDEFRLSVGAARWTANGPVPSAPYVPFLTNQLGVHFTPASAVALPARLGAAPAIVTNWNDAVENGWYTAAAGTNAPEVSGVFTGTVVTNNPGTHVTQTVHKDGGTSGDTSTWQRSRIVGVWGAWYRLRVAEEELDARYALVSDLETAGEMNVKAFGAVGDGVTDDTAAIQDALDAAAGRTLRFPAGTYLVKALTGDHILLWDRPCRIVGDGATGSGTILIVDPATPTTIDVLKIAPDASLADNDRRFWHLEGIRINGNTVARDAVNIYLDGDPLSFISSLTIDSCWFQSTDRRALSFRKDTPGTDGMFVAVFQNCFFGGGAAADRVISLDRSGDSLTFRDNIITGKGVGIYTDPINGAAHQIIENNNITADGGAIVMKNAQQVKINNNQMEQMFTYTGSEDAMVTLENCNDCDLVGNNLNAYNRVSCVKIKAGTGRTRMRENVMSCSASASKYHCVIASGAGPRNNLSAQNRFLVDGADAASNAPRVSNSATTIQYNLIKQLTLLNSWAAFNTGGVHWDGLFVVLHEDDTVGLRGRIAGGTNTPGTVIAALPAGIFPIGKAMLPSAQVLVTGPAWALWPVYVGIDGNITVPSPAFPSTTYIDFDGCRFPIWNAA